MNDFSPLLMLVIPALGLLCVRNKDDGLGFMTSAEMDESDRRLARIQSRVGSQFRIIPNDEMGRLQDLADEHDRELNARIEARRKAWEAQS